MFSRKIILTFAVIGSFFASCKKEVSNSLSGRVKDGANGNPIAGAQVLLQQLNANCVSCNPVTTLQSALTGSNGEFSFIAEPGYNYQLLAQADGYWTNFGKAVSLDDLDRHAPITLSLQPYAWLRLHIRNVLPYDGNDVIEVNDLDDLSFYGQAVDTTIFYGRVYGNSYTKVSIRVKKNNIQTDSIIRFYCPARDTSTCEIDY